MKQTASQKAKANTSTNQVPALFSKVDWSRVSVNLDWGGGKYSKGTDYLAEKDVINLVYDPYNRPVDHNEEILKQAYNTEIDSITCSNVLNVIKSKAERTKLLKQLWVIVASQKFHFNKYPPIYFSMYEKNQNGIPDEDLPQTNMRTGKYIPEIYKQFPESFEISLRNKVITVKSVSCRGKL